MDILNKKISNKIVILVISIVIVLVLSLSTTYSLIYNTKKLSSNEYTTGVLDIEYTEGNALELNNYIPMGDESGIITDPYTITITNTGNLTYKFNLSILSTVEDVSNIIDAKYIRLQVDDNEPVSLNELSSGVIYSNIVLAKEESMEIHIRMWLSEDTPNAQMGHIYSAKLVASGLAIQNTSYANTKSVGYQSLVSLGLDKYIVDDGNGIIETTSDNEYVYYFKGNIDYNYVLFNNSYYRIIGIDSNGNVKMIYSGNNDNTIIGTSSFNDKVNDSKYNGYTYLEDKEVDSNIKIILDNWYEENIKDTDYEKYVIDSVYCNDKRYTDDTGNIIYNAYDRLINNNKSSLECSPADSYTVSNSIGNGSLKYPVSLISADELSIIGNGYIDSNDSFWTFTASKFEDDIAYNFSYSNKLESSRVDEKLGVRPVLTIDYKYLKGNGTVDSPFEIEK